MITRALSLRRLNFGWGRLLALLILPTSGGYSASTIQFSSSSTNLAGNNPYYIATGDFNGDGKADFVTGNIYDNSITVGLGAGDGTFFSITNYPIAPLEGVSAGLLRVATADLNHDGRADVLVGYGYSAGHLAVFTATNGGALVRQPDLISSPYPESFDFADFNGDGNLDLVVTGGDLLIHMGDGNGGFPGTGISVSQSSRVRCVTVADLNQDGRPDLLVGGYVGDFPSVEILLGQSNGSFLTATNIPVFNDADPATRSITVADFNGDGYPDMAVGLEDEPSIAIVLQRPEGFSVFTNYLVSSEAFYCVTADFNGDGYPDLATPNDLLIGRGNGEFTLALPEAYGWSGTSLAIADVNQDGRPDVLWTMGLPICSTNSSIPTLRMGKVGGQPQMSWPAWNSFLLQSTANLKANADWTTVTNPPTEVSGRNLLAFPVDAGGRYFRLKSK